MWYEISIRNARVLRWINKSETVDNGIFFIPSSSLPIHSSFSLAKMEQSDAGRLNWIPFTQPRQCAIDTQGLNRSEVFGAAAN